MWCVYLYCIVPIVLLLNNIQYGKYYRITVMYVHVLYILNCSLYCTAFPTTTWQAARSAISINARQGSSVFIPCNPPSSAVPTPTVLWQSKTTGTADNTYETITTAPLTNRNVNMRFQIAPNSGLIIHSLVAADFGRTYRCSVTNAHTHTTVPGGQVYQLMQGQLNACIIFLYYALCTMYIHTYVRTYVCTYI